MNTNLAIVPQLFPMGAEALAQGFESDAFVREEGLPLVEALADSYATSGLGKERLLLKLDGFHVALKQKDVDVARCLGSQIAAAIRARPKPFQKLLPRVHFQLFGDAETARAQGALRINPLPDLNPHIGYPSWYRILSELKRTKYSTVFWAIEIESGRMFIIKLFDRLGEGGERELGLDKFKREWRVLQTISHPNIVKMREFGERSHTKFEGLDSMVSSSVPYIIFEWEGTSIENLAGGKTPILPLEWSSTKAIILQLASALNAVHEAGLVHRDVGANNVLLKKGKGGLWRAKLCDFGLTCDKGYFDDDSVFGTISYMSPEQLRGESLDPRADVYGLGVLLFQLLTGKLPFLGDDGDTIARQHFDASVPFLSSVRPDLSFSPEMESIVAKALAKKPVDRFQTMAEMAAAVERVR